jgi:hypothetical protein
MRYVGARVDPAYRFALAVEQRDRPLPPAVPCLINSTGRDRPIRIHPDGCEVRSLAIRIRNLAFEDLPAIGAENPHLVTRRQEDQTPRIECRQRLPRIEIRPVENDFVQRSVRRRAEQRKERKKNPPHC